MGGRGSCRTGGRTAAIVLLEVARTDYQYLVPSTPYAYRHAADGNAMNRPPLDPRPFEVQAVVRADPQPLAGPFRQFSNCIPFRKQAVWSRPLRALES